MRQYFTWWLFLGSVHSKVCCLPHLPPHFRKCFVFVFLKARNIERVSVSTMVQFVHSYNVKMSNTLKMQQMSLNYVKIIISPLPMVLERFIAQKCLFFVVVFVVVVIVLFIVHLLHKQGANFNQNWQNAFMKWSAFKFV